MIEKHVPWSSVADLFDLIHQQKRGTTPRIETMIHNFKMNNLLTAFIKNKVQGTDGEIQTIDLCGSNNFTHWQNETFIKPSIITTEADKEHVKVTSTVQHVNLVHPAVYEHGY